MGTFLSTLVDSDDRHFEDRQYTPNHDDVEVVRGYLMLWVPTELANAIIDDAQYWSKANYTVTSPDDSSTLITEFHGSYCFLLTPKLLDMIGTQKFVKVRKVGFKITSHDQGFCSENNFPSKYMGSWTWFEAAIIREVEGDTRNEQSGSTDSLQSHIQRIMNESGETTEDGMQVVIVKNPRKPDSRIWHVQRNIRALRNDTIHEVTWSDEDYEEPGEDEMKFIDMTGAGRGIGFVQSLKHGDRIAVLARAMFPAWANFINKIEVEIFYRDLFSQAINHMKSEIVLWALILAFISWKLSPCRTLDLDLDVETVLEMLTPVWYSVDRKSVGTVLCPSCDNSTRLGP
ncbi:hypothetical protein CVT25_000684 [Psilocybe cyanescens]|uniref:Uncharacterized protein n=1 Tax=Psilocybe cyanescens TaxID=93625 RepID=A0A409XUH9_PSICY|nr:hypothetical protein CVT25_000684 [Psilocybe cyanescens]